MSTSQPSAPFDFGKAVTMPFQTSGGSAFAKRLWFWTTIPLTLTFLIAVPLMASQYGALLEWYADYMTSVMGGDLPDDSDMAAFVPIMKAMIPGYLVLMFGMWISAVMGEAALHRKALLNVEQGSRPIRFGGDEGRVMLAQICVWGIILLVYTLAVFAAVLLIALLSAVMGSVGAALGAFSFIGVIAVVLSFAVRLMPASALTVKNAKLTVMEARRITKGKFWPLLGAFLVIYIGGSIVISVVQSFGMLLAFGSANPAADVMINGGDMSAIMEGAAERVKNPLVIFGGIICIIAYAAVTALWFLCLSGIGTYAALWAQGDSVDSTFD